MDECGELLAIYFSLMKNLYIKINNLWTRFNAWGKESIVGDFLVSFLRTSFFITTASLIFFGLFIISPFSESFLEETRSCNVQGIKLRGEITEYLIKSEDEAGDMVASEDVIASIEKANKDDDIKAILIEVSSPGGTVVAGAEMSIAVKNSKKPVIAYIRGGGVSAAYWTISGAERIFASENSEVGGMGITGSYTSNVGKNKKDGYEYQQLIVGKYKDTGTPDRMLTQEEKTIILRDLTIMYENFIKTVSKNRSIPLEKVRRIADGTTVLGLRAKELGLIDEIGGVNEAKVYLEKKIDDSVEVCWK